MNVESLKGKVGILTGAAHGIGRAIAQYLASYGADLCLVDVDDEALQNILAKVRDQGSSAMQVVADVSDEKAVPDVVQQAERNFAKIDFVVNNAARIIPRRWFWHLENADFDQVIATNVRGPFLLGKAVSEVMRKNASGAIVNLSSVAGRNAFRGTVPYVTSKAAIEGQTRALALELAPYSIRVNAVAPGMIATEAWDEVTSEEWQRRERLIPLGRPGNPEDIAKCVAFLVCDASEYITGQVITVDGGMSSQFYSPPDEMPHMIGFPEL